MICHVKGCQCFATWSAPQLGSTRETVHVPDEEELVGLREMFQHSVIPSGEQGASFRPIGLYRSARSRPDPLAYPNKRP